jgi:deazaflavin-dependent oxidoreductase (nitroreductase family)
MNWDPKSVVYRRVVSKKLTVSDCYRRRRPTIDNGEKDDVSVTLPPGGTRGTGMPKFARPLMKAGTAVSHLMLRLLGDRMKVQGRPLLMLTTVGAKTGKERHSIVARFADPDHPQAWIVVGSAGGAPRHPSWCYNLAKNPDQAWITVGKDHQKAHAESLKGAERETAWKRIVSAAPNFGKYETTTDRQMPIIRLTPDQRS